MTSEVRPVFRDIRFLRFWFPRAEFSLNIYVLGVRCTHTPVTEKVSRVVDHEIVERILGRCLAYFHFSDSYISIIIFYYNISCFKVTFHYCRSKALFEAS